MFTYGTVVVVGVVADLTNFVGHVVVDFFIDQLEAIVQEVLVLCVVVFFDRHRFHRVHRVEEVGEGY